MKRIAVFDLDGTLIPGDSLRRLILRCLAREPRLAAALAARGLGAASRTAFAARCHELLAPILARGGALDEHLQWISRRLVADRIAEARRRQAGGATIVLLSASPDDYVAPLGARLGFDLALGSAFDGAAYRHLYGAAKTDALAARFPKGDWRWEFAMADSPSDEVLLRNFETAERVRAR